MEKYWIDHFNKNADLFKEDLFKQVGKTVGGIAVDPNQINFILRSIKEGLQLSHQDSLIDLCCGNGLITNQLSAEVKHILGIDAAEKLILEARKVAPQNAVYIKKNIANLSKKDFKNCNKFLMYEALQHLNQVELANLLNKIKLVKDKFVFFIGSIPDKTKIRIFYNTEEKYNFYLSRESDQQPHMGRWWTMDELTDLASSLELKISYSPQSEELYTASYRFDAIIETP